MPVTAVANWGHLGLSPELTEGIAKQGFTTPTPIQCASCPSILAGRDVLALAQTGSGKTAAYVIPMVVHLSMQDELPKGQGPIALVVAPSRCALHIVMIS